MTAESDIVIKGNIKDLGGFSVVRSIPQAKRRNVGPFIFFDHLGPMSIDSKHFLDVRPHPHIGLATVTYLLEGRGHHRDNLGSDQIINPGDINLMTAGRGIVHSERTPCDDIESLGNKVHGIQVWMGLPKEDEDCEPSFVHWPKKKLPDLEGCQLLRGKLMIGEYAGKTSPVRVLSPTLFMDLQATSAGSEVLNFEYEEIGVFIVEGQCVVNGNKVAPNDLVIASTPESVEIEFSKDARLIVVGGSAFPGPRYIWWNFVSSEKEKIRSAAKQWEKQEMGKVEGETDFIPLPSDPMI